MLKQGTIIDDWIEEGVERGRAQEAREMLFHVLRGRFGALPERVVKRVESADVEWCRDVARRVIQAESLQELGL